MLIYFIGHTIKSKIDGSSPRLLQLDQIFPVFSYSDAIGIYLKMIETHLFTYSDNVGQVIASSWFPPTQFNRICPACIQHESVHPFNGIETRFIGRFLVTVGKTNGTMEVTAISGHDYRRGGILLMFWAKPTVIGTTPIMASKPLLRTCRNSITTKLSPFKIMFSVVPPNNSFIIAMLWATFLQINLVIFSNYPCWYPL